MIEKTKQPVLKEVKEFMEPGYWVDEQIKLGEQKRLMEVRHYDENGKLYQKNVYPIGIQGPDEHVVIVNYESINAESGMTTEISIYKSDTWEFLKKEYRTYDDKGALIQLKELIIDQEGEQLLKSCSVESNDKGRTVKQLCTTLWGKELINTFEYDNNGFLINLAVKDKGDNIISYEVYENDRFGNPLRKTAYASVPSENNIISRSVCENRYW